MTEFRDIPLPGRIIIIAIAVGVFAVAGVAVATSYNAVYRLVESLGLYGSSTNKTFGTCAGSPPTCPSGRSSGRRGRCRGAGPPTSCCSAAPPRSRSTCSTPT